MTYTVTKSIVNKPRTHDNEAKDVTIDGLQFKVTCHESPEQYDVFIDGVNVAYVRLRHGYLYVSDPELYETWWDSDGETLKGDGIFYNQAERDTYLAKIADVIKRKTLTT